MSTTATTTATTTPLNKQRRGIQRKSAPINTHKPASEDTRDHVMTSEEFAKWKPALMRTLWRVGDPPPRTMNHGRGGVSAHGQFTRNVRELLSKNASRGSVLVRGFKLMHIRLNQNKWGSWGVQNAWKATFHMVVAHPPSKEGCSKWVYEDANLPPDNEDIDVPYIFVPSSRGHAELTDEEALSNKWVLGYVIGGNADFCEMVIADQKLRGRRRSVLGTTPEEVISKRAQKCYLMPLFESWYRLREIQDPMECVAEQLGFPTVDIDESLDLQNPKATRLGINNNSDATVDGHGTLNLHNHTAEAMRRGELSEDQIQELMFKHYDAQYMLVEKRQSMAMDKVLAEMGYLAQGSAQSAC
jgi:hypothetical protein